MRTADFFLSTDGRLDRERWLGAISLLVAVFIATFIITASLDRLGVISPIGRERTRVFVWFALLVPWVMLDWKRFQDRDKLGMFALICPSLHAVSRLIAIPSVAVVIPASAMIAVILSIIQIGVAAWYIYDLAYCKGTDGYNTYGPPPQTIVSAPSTQQPVPQQESEASGKLVSP